MWVGGDPYVHETALFGAGIQTYPMALKYENIYLFLK
uniref:Uncharacterized protein n=1 Tax=Lepeophtheirus salmonis TaxID=72036 RepID=A0A0K2U6Y2_LEPSM